MKQLTYLGMGMSYDQDLLSYELVCLSYDQAGRILKYWLVVHEKYAILLLLVSTVPMQSCVNSGLHPRAQFDPNYVAQLTSQLASLRDDNPSAKCLAASCTDCSGVPGLLLAFTYTICYATTTPRKLGVYTP
jgi:hypothetical protein